MNKGVFFWFVGFMVLVVWGVVIFHPPTWVFAVGFGILFLFYTNTFKERVPLYLSNHTTGLALSELLIQYQKQDQKQNPKRPKFIDLGCGLGGTVAFLAKTHPGWDMVGVETAPGPYIISKVRCAFVNNAEIRFQNLWSVDLSSFDVAYAFLSPAPMARLCAKVKAEMPKGALFISNSFWANEAPYDEDIWVNDSRKTHFFCIRL